MKLAKHKKRCYYYHVLKKDLACLLKKLTKYIMPTHRIFLMKTSGKSTRPCFNADDRQSTREVASDRL